MAGLPALVVPCGFVEGGSAGLPVGLQMIGSPFSEVKYIAIVSPNATAPFQDQFSSPFSYFYRFSCIK